jgi:uncharacterized protein (DUF1778 family)
VSISQTQAKRAQRLETRLTHAQKRLIERAAELKGTTVTEFVLSSAQQAAAETIRSHEVMVLRGEAAKVFVEALLHPPAPNAEAHKAVRRYKRRMGL